MVLKLSQEIRRFRVLVSVAEEALDAVAGCSEAAQRLRAALPALQAKPTPPWAYCTPATCSHTTFHKNNKLWRSRIW